MRNYLNPKIIFFYIILFVFACKRETVSENEKLDTTKRVITQKVKKWFEKVYQVSLDDGVAQGKEPSWDNVEILQEEGKVLVSIDNDGDLQKFKYLIFNMDIKGNVVGGMFNLLVFNNKKHFTNANEIMVKYTKRDTTAITSECSILSFDMNSKLISNEIFGTKKGILKQNIFTSIPRFNRTQKKEVSQFNNPTLPCEGGQWVQVDWYLTVFEDGVLVDYYYLFSTWSCTGYVPGGGGSGGGGSGGGGETESCDLCIQGGAISSEELRNVTYVVGEESEYNQGVERLPKVAKWVFLKLSFGLGYVASYSAFFNGIIYREPRISSMWKWESLVYSQTSQSGGTVPPCLSVSTSVNLSGPIISADGSKATASLTYTANGSITCLGGMQAFTKSGTINGQEFFAN